MRVCIVCCLLLGAVSSLSAAVEYQDRIETYTVKPGDTVRGITVQFLGTVDFWEANWKLNPQVKNPNMLRIGQTLQIIVARRVMAERASVEAAVNKAEKQLASTPWERAQIGDQIASGDALRTREKSVAELRFNPSSSLRLNEFSQVFLAKKETTLQGVDRASVEVSQGEVDIFFDEIERGKTQIEVINGASIATAIADADGKGAIRTGLVQTGGSRVMVFSGASQVSAAGASVQVDKGMGTRVPEKGPPAQPEKLLPAPKLINAEVAWTYNNARLYWQPVASADSYTVEVCADSACQQLIQRNTSVKNTFQQAEPLARGKYFWRVSAVSKSELDGYASQLGKIDVAIDHSDLQGPMLALIPVSGFIEAKSGQLLFGQNALITFVAQDEYAGVQKIEFRIDDSAWQALTPDGISLPADGKQLQVRALDNLDQPSPIVAYQMQLLE